MQLIRTLICNIFVSYLTFVIFYLMFYDKCYVFIVDVFIFFLLFSFYVIYDSFLHAEISIFDVSSFKFSVQRYIARNVDAFLGKNVIWAQDIRYSFKFYFDNVPQNADLQFGSYLIWFLQIIHVSLYKQYFSLYKILKKATVLIFEILKIPHTFYHGNQHLLRSNYSHELLQIFHFRCYYGYLILIPWLCFSAIHTTRVFYVILFVKSKYRRFLGFLSFHCSNHHHVQ